MPGMQLPRVHQQRCDLSPLGCPAHAKLVWDISHRDLELMLNEMTPGARSAVMRYLRAVLFYGIKRGYLRENPIARLDFAGRPRREVETIPVGQVAAILNYALEHDLGLLPFLVPGFFAGIRLDGELQKVEWRDVDFSDGVVTLRPEVSQTKRRRFPELSANAVAWIRAYVARGGRTSSRIVPFNASQLRAHRTADRSAAGITKWPHQGMLHTYRSNWLALHGCRRWLHNLLSMLMNEIVDELDEKLPISVEPCPIVEALTEIRFEPSVSPDAVFGYAHRALQGDVYQSHRPSWARNPGSHADLRSHMAVPTASSA
jgi:integrase